MLDCVQLWLAFIVFEASGRVSKPCSTILGNCWVALRKECSLTQSLLMPLPYTLNCHGFTMEWLVKSLRGLRWNLLTTKRQQKAVKVATMAATPSSVVSWSVLVVSFLGSTHRRVTHIHVVNACTSLVYVGSMKHTHTFPV